MAKSSKSQQKEQRNRTVLKVLLAVISTLVIVYFMPRNDKVGYSYEINQPWRYSKLVAPYQFPIYKSDSVIQHEKDSMMRTFMPYYYKNEDVRQKMHNRLYTTTAKQWTGPNSSMYVHHISAMLDSIYKKGVLSVADYNAIVKRGHKGVRLIDASNQAYIISKDNLFSTRSAYEYILGADTTKYSRLVMQHFNINELLAPNMHLDEAKSKMEQDAMLSDITGANGIVRSGQKIIDRGELVTRETYEIIKSYERYTAKETTDDSPIPYSLVGQLVYVLVIMFTLISYLAMFRADYFEHKRSAIMLFTLITLFCVLASLMVENNFLNIAMLPCCMVPIIIRVFMDSRTAFMFHCAMVLIISFMLQNGFLFLIIQISTGMIAIQTLRELSQRSQIIRTAALIGFSYIIFYICYAYILDNRGESVERYMYMYFAINAGLLILTYPLLYLLEKSFGFTSDVTLVELNNINNPLLQRMTEIAPGTFQHSMQVANLASEVAKKIKAKSQLVRTGAMYHDIGKLERPVFFTENQRGISPHKHLSAQKSAEVIIAHVTNGIALANKYNLPESIKRFIVTHHGYGMAKYFYITYKNEHPDDNIDEALFRYPGPNPGTKEEAILMMADAVEAASRSLTEYTEESIGTLVDKIIDNQMAEGYFHECDITFKDIATAKAVFKEKLEIIYHTRISYPELIKEDGAKENNANQKVDGAKENANQKEDGVKDNTNQKEK